MQGPAPHRGRIQDFRPSPACCAAVSRADLVSAYLGEAAALGRLLNTGGLFHRWVTMSGESREKRPVLSGMNPLNRASYGF